MTPHWTDLENLPNHVQRAVDAIHSGEKAWVRVAQPDVSPPRVLVCGSFNPIHQGHFQMAKIAAEYSQQAVDFELSISNADKPPVPIDEIQRRVRVLVHAAQNAATGPVAQGLVLTDQPTFAAKAQLFPGAIFVTGVDTILRIAEQRFYQNDAQLLNSAIDQLSRSGCHFLVFGRLVESRFLDLESIDLPVALRQLCRGVSESVFRHDISSTALREQQRRC